MVGGPNAVSPGLPSHGLPRVYPTLYAALSEGMSGHPLPGGKEHSTFLFLHSTLDKAGHALHAGQGLLLKYLKDQAGNTNEGCLVAYNKAWRGLWQAGEHCCLLIGQSSGTGKKLCRDRSPGSLACQVTIAK